MENKGHTEEGEPGEEGSGAEMEQRQQQNDEVKRDGVGFTPPAIKHQSGAVFTHIVLESTVSRLDMDISLVKETRETHTVILNTLKAHEMQLQQLK